MKLYFQILLFFVPVFFTGGIFGQVCCFGEPSADPGNDPTDGLGTIYETISWGGTINYQTGQSLTPTIGNNIVASERNVVIRINNFVLNSLSSGVIAYSGPDHGCGGFAFGIDDSASDFGGTMQLYIQVGQTSGTNVASLLPNNVAYDFTPVAGVFNTGQSYTVVIEFAVGEVSTTGGVRVWVDNSLILEDEIDNNTPICSYDWADVTAVDFGANGVTKAGLGTFPGNELADVSGTPTMDFWESTLSTWTP